MSERKKKKNASGATRMREAGFKAVGLWLDPQELAVIDQAALLSRAKRASWIRSVVFAEACRILQSAAGQAAAAFLKESAPAPAPAPAPALAPGQILKMKGKSNGKTKEA